MKKKIFSIYIPLILLSGCGKSFESHQRDKIMKNTLNLLEVRGGSSGKNFFKLPTKIENIPQDKNNPITLEKIALGKVLFHDPIIAINNRDSQNARTYSCASCHISSAGFTSGNLQGIAEGGLGEGSRRGPSQFSNFFDVQPIKVPATLNLAFQKNLLWSGALGNTDLNFSTQEQWEDGTPMEFNHWGFEGAETQALAGQMVHGLFDQSTTNAETASLSSDIFSNQEYISLFKRAFPSKENDPDLISQETVAMAIAAYDRSIIADQAPFQKFLQGDTKALTFNQIKGLNLFLNKGQCYKCHTGPALNSMQFHSLGFNDFNPANTIIKEGDESAFLGRGGFTKDPIDNYKFKVPQLYNIKDHFRLGHGGSFRSVREVIEYKNRGVSQNPNVPSSQLSDLFIPLNLSPEEISSLVDFIENGLKDPSLERYIPTNIPSNLCFPSNENGEVCL